MGREEPYRFVSVAKLRRDFEADIQKYGRSDEKEDLITVDSLTGALDRFEQVWQRSVAGRTRSAEIRLTFESLPVLLKNLTPARWTLLEAVKRSGPMSINVETFVVDRQARIAYKHIVTLTPAVMENALLPMVEKLRK